MLAFVAPGVVFAVSQPAGFGVWELGTRFVGTIGARLRCLVSQCSVPMIHDLGFVG